MAGVSPSSSPRLPSPPPIAEDQIGPKSPIAASEEQGKLFSSVDHGASRRIRPGTKAADMAEGPPLVELIEIDSAFQLTEHLKALHNFLTHPLGSTTTIPIDKQKARRLAQPPEGVDRALWLYELCRFLTQKVNSIIIALFSDSPPCSSQICPEMRASEWQYLCAVHDPPKSCCAIDYCCHTLDWAANTLTSPKHFPSRLALGTETNSAPQQVRQLTNIFRRVYRIFAHAWFQHRDMFWKVENKSGLYIFFKTVCDVYSLIPEDNFTIPSEAEGIDSTPVSTAMNPPTILQKDDQIQATNENGPEGAADTTIASGNTTKRHRPTPSIGATSVATVVEENEEEEEHQPKEDEPKPEWESGSEPIPTPGPESEPEPGAEAEVESEVKPEAEPEAGKEEEKPNVEEEPIAVANESGDPPKGEIELEQPQIATTEPEGQSPPEGEDSQPEKEEKSGADQASTEAPVEKATAEKEKSAAGDAGEASTSVGD